MELKRRRPMTEREKELAEAFRKLSPETQENVVSHTRFAVMAENAVKRQYNLGKEPPKDAA
jgi:hypothetical protein